MQSSPTISLILLRLTGRLNLQAEHITVLLLFCAIYRAFVACLFSRHFGDSSQDSEDEGGVVAPFSITGVLNEDPAESASVDVMHLPAHRRCATHTLNLIAAVDVETGCSDRFYCSIASAAFAKRKSVWNKQGQSVLAAESIKEKLGRYFPVPNTTRWNSLYDTMRFIDDTPKFKIDAVCDVLSLPRLQRNDTVFIAEYCQVCLRCLFSIIRVNNPLHLISFYPTMKGVARTLDILQGEKYMFMGALLPTLQSLLRHLHSMPELMFCGPLVKALKLAVKTRRVLF